MEPRLPLRRRVLPVLALAFAAPICGEFLQAYLPDTGDAVAMLTALLILAPLYGGAALLIRELAVRNGRGWPGVLLLAAAFGVAMPGLVDLSLFVEHRDDVVGWEETRRATLIAPLGISAFPALLWVVGHVTMSVGAPLAVLDVLAPRHRGRPLLGPWGIGVAATGCVGAALLIRADQARAYGASPPAATSLVVVAAVVGLIALALTPMGRPMPPGNGAPVRSSWLAAGGAAVMFSIDLLPAAWPGVAAVVVLLTGSVLLIRRWARRSAWSTREAGALAAGALIGRTLIGFLAPLPEGVSLAGKLSQNAALLVLVVAVAVLVLRRGQRRPRTGTTSGPSSPGMTRTLAP